MHVLERITEGHISFEVGSLYLMANISPILLTLKILKHILINVLNICHIVMWTISDMAKNHVDFLVKVNVSSFYVKLRKFLL